MPSYFIKDVMQIQDVAWTKQINFRKARTKFHAMELLTMVDFSDTKVMFHTFHTFAKEIIAILIMKSLRFDTYSH